MRGALAWTTVCLALLACASVAGATPAAHVMEDIALADEYWGGPPPQCTEITVSLTPNVGRAGESTLPNPDFYGPCYMAVTEVGTVTPEGFVYTPEYACLVAVHERGHLNGLGHSTDPADIMYGPTDPDDVTYGRFPLRSDRVPQCQEPPELQALPTVSTSEWITTHPHHHRHHKRFRRGAPLRRVR